MISKKMYKGALYFIDDIPDGKLLGGWRGETHTIHKDVNVRFDMQKMTTGSSYWNVQVQCNKNVKITSVAQAAESKNRKGPSIAIALIPADLSWSPAQIKDELRSSLKRMAGR